MLLASLSGPLCTRSASFKFRAREGRIRGQRARLGIGREGRKGAFGERAHARKRRILGKQVCKATAHLGERARVSKRCMLGNGAFGESERPSVEGNGAFGGKSASKEKMYLGERARVRKQRIWRKGACEEMAHFKERK